MRRTFLTMFAAAATLLVMGAGMTGAYFTGQARMTDNIVKAGTLAVSTEPTAAALSVDSLAPGTETTRTLSILNAGSLPESVVCTSSKSAGVTALWETLTVRVTDAEGAVLYDGPLSAMHTAPVRLEKGARLQLGFAIGLPESAGNDLAGDYAKFAVTVDGEQVR